MKKQFCVRASIGLAVLLVALGTMAIHEAAVVTASSSAAKTLLSAGVAKRADAKAIVDSSEDFDFIKVADGVYAAITKATGLPSGNSGFIIGDDGVMVVDTTLAPVTARELIAEIKKITPLPIRYALNTHYHLDHSGGNQVFAEMNVPIISRDNTREWVTTRNKKFFPPGDGLQKRRDSVAKQLAELGTSDEQKRGSLERQLRAIDAELSIRFTAPDLTYKTGTVQVYLGKREVIVSSYPGHTGGDSIAYVPDANVVFTGDLAWRKTLPNLVDATVNDWIPTLDTLLSEHPNATFVPGHGGVATADDIRDFRGYLSDLRETVRNAIAEGLTLDQAKEQLQLPEKYKSYAIQGFVKPDIENMYNELKGTKVYN